MSIIYDLLFLIFSLCYVPFLFIKGKWHAGFKVRFGAIPSEVKEKLSRTDNIWVHAVSVGEVLAIKKFAGLLKDMFPLHRVVITTVTLTGYKLALGTFPKDQVLYAPVDLSFAVRKFIAVIKPKIYIAAETEIWPNLFLALFRSQVPIAQINGRISDRSFCRYMAFKILIGPTLKRVGLFCMQSDTDAKKITAMGANPNGVVVTGNMKFDDLPNPSAMSASDLGLKEDDLVIVAGSTHAGEEEILLECYQKLLKEFTNLKLIVAPRHIERADEIKKTIATFGYEAIFHSKREHFHHRTVLVVDTIGDLKNLYRLASIVFIGKSLTAKGGQNLIEPAFFKKAIVIGPFMDNFKDVTALFLNEKAVIQIKNKEELFSALEALLKYPQRREQYAIASLRTIEKHKGATGRTIEHVAKLLAQ